MVDAAGEMSGPPPRASLFSNGRHRITEFAGWMAWPPLVAFLPGRLAHRLCLWLAGRPRLFPLDQADALPTVPDASGSSASIREQWRARHRLIHLVDRADAWLSRFRPDKWLDEAVDQRGDEWPQAPFVAVTFHFGAGLWALRDIARQRGPIAFLSTRFDRSAFRASPIAYYAARWRMGEVARAGGAPVVYTGGSRRAMRVALARGVSVAGLIDVPPGQTRGFLPVSFLGETAWFPCGLVELARDAEVPLVAFAMGLSGDSMRRVLTIRVIGPGPIEVQLAEVVGLLEAAIAEDPSAWHRWRDLQAFRQSPLKIQ